MKIPIVYHSLYGHTLQLARAIEEGVKSASGVEAVFRRAPEFPHTEKELEAGDGYATKVWGEQKQIPACTLDDLREADGLLMGSPTRYGNMTAQMKQFIDTTGSLWMTGELEDKVTGVFTSTATIHGGQESTILTSLVPLLHLGMIFIGTPYGQNPQIMVTDGIGGSPYGPGTLAGPDGSRQPVESELQTARNLGSRAARVSALTRVLRQPQSN